MSSLETYKNAFKKLFEIEDSSLDNLVYQGIPEWDSISHMELMTILENEFSIEMDIDDIIDFSSFELGKSILAKYGVQF
jgi:acyl carrier protein